MVRMAPYVFRVETQACFLVIFTNINVKARGATWSLPGGASI